MDRLMDEVLLLSKVEAGKMEFKPEPLDLAGFCERVVQEILSATNHQVPIQLEMDRLPAHACGDENLLRHIFTNLCSGGPMKKILVIEDDEQTRSNLATILTMEGYQAIIAPNGRSGVELALKEMPT